MPISRRSTSELPSTPGFDPEGERRALIPDGDLQAILSGFQALPQHEKRKLLASLSPDVLAADLRDGRLQPKDIRPLPISVQRDALAVLTDNTRTIPPQDDEFNKLFETLYGLKGQIQSAEEQRRAVAAGGRKSAGVTFAGKALSPDVQHALIYKKDPGPFHDALIRVPHPRREAIFVQTAASAAVAFEQNSIESRRLAEVLSVLADLDDSVSIDRHEGKREPTFQRMHRVLRVLEHDHPDALTACVPEISPELVVKLRVGPEYVSPPQAAHLLRVAAQHIRRLGAEPPDASRMQLDIADLEAETPGRNWKRTGVGEPTHRLAQAREKRAARRRKHSPRLSELSAAPVEGSGTQEFPELVIPREFGSRLKRLKPDPQSTIGIFEHGAQASGQRRLENLGMLATLVTGVLDREEEDDFPFHVVSELLKQDPDATGQSFEALFFLAASRGDEHAAELLDAHPTTRQLLLERRQAAVFANFPEDMEEDIPLPKDEGV